MTNEQIHINKVSNGFSVNFHADNVETENMVFLDYDTLIEYLSTKLA